MVEQRSKKVFETLTFAISGCRQTTLVFQKPKTGIYFTYTLSIPIPHCLMLFEVLSLPVSIGERRVTKPIGWTVFRVGQCLVHHVCTGLTSVTVKTNESTNRVLKGEEQ